MSEFRTERERILHNMYLFECEKNQRLKSFWYRMRLGWYNFKKKFTR